MLVSLYPNIDKSRTNKSKKVSTQYRSQAPNFTTTKFSNNISFKGEFSTALLVARSGYAAINGILKNIKTNKLIDELKCVLNKPSEYRNDLYTAILALSRTPNERKMGQSEIKLLKEKVFTQNIFSHIKDDSPINIQLKKDFFNDRINEGWEISEEFISVFKSLPEQNYRTFKEELIDKILYSTEYRKKIHKEHDPRWDTIPNENIDNQLRNEVALTESLDKNVHSEYLNKISPQIREYKRQIFNNLKTDRLYDLFNTNLNPLLNPNYTPLLGKKVEKTTATGLHTRSIDPYAKLFLAEAINTCGNDTAKLSKLTGMKEYLAKDILMDNFYIHKTNRLDNQTIASIALNKLIDPHYEIRRRSLSWLKEPVDIDRFLKENENHIIKLHNDTYDANRHGLDSDFEVLEIIEKLQAKYKFTFHKLGY